MRKPNGIISIKVDEQDFGTVCVCALRYAMGRETYMPSLVRDFVRSLLPKLPGKTLAVMIKDCEWQELMNMWGSDTIDKPGWVRWKQELLAEKERRGQELGSALVSDEEVKES